jgi:hypothetical protein
MYPGDEYAAEEKAWNDTSYLAPSMVDDTYMQDNYDMEGEGLKGSGYHKDRLNTEINAILSQYGINEDDSPAVMNEIDTIQDDAEAEIEDITSRNLPPGPRFSLKNPIVNRAIRLVRQLAIAEHRRLQNVDAMDNARRTEARRLQIQQNDLVNQLDALTLMGDTGNSAERMREAQQIRQALFRVGDEARFVNNPLNVPRGFTPLPAVIPTTIIPNYDSPVQTIDVAPNTTEVYTQDDVADGQELLDLESNGNWASASQTYFDRDQANEDILRKNRSNTPFANPINRQRVTNTRVLRAHVTDPTAPSTLIQPAGRLTVGRFGRTSTSL